jgi:hypothetical protein
MRIHPVRIIAQGGELYNEDIEGDRRFGHGPSKTIKSLPQCGGRSR